MSDDIYFLLHPEGTKTLSESKDAKQKHTHTTEIRKARREASDVLGKAGARSRYKQKFEVSEKERQTLVDQLSKLESDLTHERQLTRSLTTQVQELNKTIQELQTKLLQEKEANSAFLKEQLTKNQQAMQSAQERYTGSLEQSHQTAMQMLNQSLKQERDQVKGILGTCRELLLKAQQRPKRENIVARLEEERKQYEATSKRAVSETEFKQVLQKRLVQADDEYKRQVTTAVETQKKQLDAVRSKLSQVSPKDQTPLLCDIESAESVLKELSNTTSIVVLPTV